MLHNKYDLLKKKNLIAELPELTSSLQTEECKFFCFVLNQCT